jgi:hypothetical protein
MQRLRYFNKAIDLREFDAGETTVDTSALAKTVQDTFLLSMNGDLPEHTQATLNALGQKLRGQLRELLGEVFIAGAEPLTAANAKIGEVNAHIDAAKADINRIADVMQGLGALAGALDKLLALIGVFL